MTSTRGESHQRGAAPHAASAGASPFGRELRRWREARGMSQLRLASAAATSPRYVSFVETGRSRPSRAVVLRLAEALDVPLRERNRLLVAAGLAPMYPERALGDAALEPHRRIVATLLARHAPYPAVAFDRAYRVVDANAAARRLLPALEGTAWLDAFFAPDSPLRAALENLPEVGWGALELLRAEAEGADALDALVARLEGHLAGVPRPAPDVFGGAPVLTPRLRVDDRVVAMIVTVLRFANARDITLQELRVELFFPADDASARFFAELAAASTAP